MATFNVLHISDLHFASEPNIIGLNDVSPAALFRTGRPGFASSHSPDVAEELLAFVGEAKGIDAVLITGDLATTGNSQDLSAAKEYVSKFRRVAPLFVVPGNHDRFGALGLPGNRLFDSMFDWQAGMQQAEVIGVLEREGSRLVLVGADLCLPQGQWGDTMFGYAGQGIASPGVLRSLERESQAARTKFGSDAALAWAVHFPPQFPQCDPSLKLLNDRGLIKAAKAAGVPTIFAGHTHKDMIYVRDDVTVMCAGSATQHVSPWGNTIHWCRIRTRRGGYTVERSDLRWREDTGRFELAA